MMNNQIVRSYANFGKKTGFPATLAESRYVTELVSLRLEKVLFLVLCFEYPITYAATSLEPTLFSTKTAYRDSVARQYQNVTREAGTSSAPNHQEYSDDIRIEGHTCKLMQLNAVIRHGIRNIGGDDIHHFAALSRRVLHFLSVPERAIWILLGKRLNNFDAQQLFPEGRAELHDLGQRLGKRFKSLFAISSSEEFLFMASSRSRTYASGTGFIQGLADLRWIHGFGDGDSVDIDTRDDILRFYDFCDRYIRGVGENKTALAEFDKYKDEVFDKIGRSFLNNLPMTEDDASTAVLRIKSIYYAAAIERALLGSTSIADHLSRQELHQLEYALDLKQYWSKSYGHSIAYQQACPLAKDIFGHMDSAVRGQRYHKGIFRFGHSGTFLPMMSLLGLYNDTLPLMADNFPLQRQRHFRTSLICPFMANLMFALYKCAPQERAVEKPVQRHFVRLFHNERSIPFPFPCHSPDNKVCEYHTLRQHYAQVVDNWNCEEICAIRGTNLNGTMKQKCSTTTALTCLSLVLLGVWQRL